MQGSESTAYTLLSAPEGTGSARQLIETLITECDAAGIWTLQSGIFPENVSSIELHRHCGFRIVGTRERLGQLNGVWRDVVLMERRAPETFRDFGSCACFRDILCRWRNGGK